jgi:hypothetical protein
LAQFFYPALSLPTIEHKPERRAMTSRAKTEYRYGEIIA